MTHPSPPRSNAETRESMRRADRFMRRMVLLGIGGIGASIAGLAVGIPLLFPDARPHQRFSNHRAVLPLLRARMTLRVPHTRDARARGTPPGDLPADEALLVLVRSEMRDLGAPAESPAPRERLQLRAYMADDIWDSESRLVAIVEPGGAPDASLIAAQGGTVWIWADRLVAAAPSPDARGADPSELMRLNPDLGLDWPGLRARLSLGEALILDGSPAGHDGWAFDPATRIATRRAEPRSGPLPPLHAPTMASPAVAREGRAGTTWFGLLPEDMTLTGALSPQNADGAFLPPNAAAGPARLWRGRVRNAAQGSEVLEAAEPVPDLDPLPAGGLLMAGPGRLLELTDPPSILLAQVGRVIGMREWVRRVRLDGTPQPEIELPSTEEIQAALVEPGRLWLLTHRRGLGQYLHAVALNDGRVIRTRGI